MASVKVDEIFKLLFSHAKLDRDRGLNELQSYIVTAEQADIEIVENEFIDVLKKQEGDWETRHGTLFGSKILLQSSKVSNQFCNDLKGYALQYIEDNEVRLRLASGEVLGVLCKKIGSCIYEEVREEILKGVKTNLERQTYHESSKEEQEEAQKLIVKLGTQESNADVAQIFHDTAGWKNLETWMKCLQCVIEGCEQSFNSYIDQNLLDLVFLALAHTNRFVRETGYQVCGAVVNCAAKTEDGKPTLTVDNAVFNHGEQFAVKLAEGLADNWSQVRLASSVSTRNFLQSMPDENSRKKFYALLLPPMCLNRYYVAEGVRIYSQNTWKMVTGGDGKQLVEEFIKEIVEFYIKQTEADNHAVREAACACIAELGSKVSQDVVRPYVPQLLDALLVCFQDDSWPVRDASCVACGNFIRCFPAESKCMLDDLFPLFFGNLQDNIPSVRQGAAVAIGNVCEAYGSEIIPRVITKLKEGLTGIENQPQDSEKFSNLDKGPTVYGVAKMAHDNDLDLHTNKQMYSCGSLAPKMGRGKRGGGCMDHQFRRPAQPWELADGCVYLVGELSRIQSEAQTVGNLIPLLSKAALKHDYHSHHAFLETVCKQLPVISKGLGKRPFKMYFEYFIDCIFYSVSSDNALTSTAGSQCLNYMATFLGSGILRGRIEAYNPRYLDVLDRTLIIP